MRLALYLLTLVVIVQNAFADATTATVKLDSFLASSFPADGPGAVVAVVRNGEVVYKKSVGLADVDKNLPLTFESAFDLASVSKQFTAMGIMMLAEHGKLNYDDPVTKFLPEYSSFNQRFTIRNLLNHTSGLPEYEALYKQSGLIDTNYPRAAKRHDGYEPTSQDALKILAQSAKLRFTPGEKYEYNDSGYVSLAQIIERVSGKRYGEFLQQNIFDPVGMTHTAVYDEKHTNIAHRALSYARKRAGFKCIDYTPLNLIYGDGNVNTTINDMIKWDAALKGTNLVSRATLDQAFTRGELNNGTDINYGFGWGIGSFKGSKVVQHAGGWVGFRTHIWRCPDRKLSIIVLSNFADSAPKKIVDEALKDFGE